MADATPSTYSGVLIWRYLLIALVSINYVIGNEDIYSNSHISPKSKDYQILDAKIKGDTTSKPEEILSTDLSIDETSAKPNHESTPTLQSSATLDLGDNSHMHKATVSLAYGTGYDEGDDKDVERSRVERSALPILDGRQADYSRESDRDGNRLEENDVNVRAGHRYKHLSPTRTLGGVRGRSGNIFSTNQGEVLRAPRGKALPLQEPTISPSATTVNFATETFKGRQASPDIQDIITGIVKLLNGNVNVQANTAPPMGRPSRPVSTRINNRGPPRISDLPPLPPDFDSPPSSSVLPPPPLGQMPPPPSQPVTKIPPPYPFDLPHQTKPPVRPFLNGVPLPEQIVPIGSHRPPTLGGNFHGGGGRPPGLPPWHRRRPPHRRPPNIPVYKPMPPMMEMEEEIISLTSEEPANQPMTQESMIHQHIPISESDDNEPSGVQTEAAYHDLNYGDNVDITNLDTSITEEPEIASSKPIEIISKDELIKDSINPDKKKDKDKLYPKPEKTSVEKETTEFKFEILEDTSEINSSPVPTSIEISTMNVTSGEITTIENENGESYNPPPIMEIEGIGEAIPILETSITEIESSMAKISEPTSSTATPTEGLPAITSTNLATSTENSVLETLDNNINKQTSSTSSSTSVDSSSAVGGFPYYQYRPRPGIVLDDTEYKPGGHRHPPSVITARPTVGHGEIFDVTVSAIQGPDTNNGGNGQGKPFIYPVDIEGILLAPTNADVITSPSGSEGFVSIDGKRTYLNLFGDTGSTSVDHQSIVPTKSSSSISTNSGTIQITGTGYAVPQTDIPLIPSRGAARPPQQKRPSYNRKPQPPVRIDTCIVGDPTTCDETQHEQCRTESGVSSCHCRPGHARRKHREPCRRVVALVAALRVDRMREHRIVWSGRFLDQDTDEYRQLAYEASRAIDSAMSMTPFSDDFIEARVNNIFHGPGGAGGVFVNSTLLLQEDVTTLRQGLAHDVQHQLMGAIQRRSNNIGNSALWVDGLAGAVSPLLDLDECANPEFNDCHAEATCSNVFGGFTCECGDGLRDPWSGSKVRAGRQCERCPASRCHHRGVCRYEADGQQVCVCSGNYYGSQCEVDGEVVGVAVGASVAAIIVIVLTLICLVMWSRRWNREQKNAAAGLGGAGSPVFGYMAAGTGGTVKTPVVGPPPYQLTLEDRMRWAHLADVMAQANHYAPEPVGAVTRPSSAVFGYPTLSMHGTMPPVPLPRLGLQSNTCARSTRGAAASRNGDNTSSSEEEDRADLLGRSFQVPRPKSRSSVANQSGIYYDVDYDQGDMYKHQSGPVIPMSTYTPGRPPYFRN